MAKTCDECGSKLSWGSKGLCSGCQEKRAAAEIRDRDAARVAEVNAHLAKVNKWATDRLETVRQTVAAGSTAWLYDYNYLSVDSLLDEMDDPIGLTITQLNELGYAGWEVVTAIPRTYTGTRTYKVRMGNAYGMKGWSSQEHKSTLSGNVIGAYVLVRFAVTEANFERVKSVVWSNLVDNLPEQLFRLPPLGDTKGRPVEVADLPAPA